MTKTLAHEWLTLAEFCIELKVPKGTAYQWTSSGWECGAMPQFIKLPNGQIRIRRDHLDEWLDRRLAA